MFFFQFTNGPALCKPAAAVVSALASVLSGMMFWFFVHHGKVFIVLFGFRIQIMASRVGEHLCCKLCFQRTCFKRM